FTPSSDLVDGPHKITATATNSLGNVSPETGEYPIVVDTTAPAKPAADAAVLTDNEGAVVGEIVNGTETDDNTPTFTGKTEGDATVVIYDGEKELGRVKADADGNWSFTPSPALENGPHSLKYEVIDKAGNLGPQSDAIDFIVDTSK